MKNVIRIGDPTSHGGEVVESGAPHFIISGKPVASVGDKTSCVSTLPQQTMVTNHPCNDTEVMRRNAMGVMNANQEWQEQADANPRLMASGEKLTSQLLPFYVDRKPGSPLV